MRRASVFLSSIAILLGAWRAGPPAQAPVADFKLQMEFEVIGPEEVDTGELVFHGGRAFQFAPKSAEILLFDLANQRVELLDVGRQVQARVSYERLDRHLAALRKVLLDKAESLEKKGGKANRLTGQTTRQLIEPGFTETFHKETGRLRLVNPVVEVDAAGVAEPDPKRLETIRLLLGAAVKLGSMRYPTNIPPFTRLDATEALVGKHGLRPTDMAFLYRIAGAPVKYRWSYRLIPALTERDLKDIERLDRFRARATLMTFDEFEKTK